MSKHLARRIVLAAFAMAALTGGALAATASHADVPQIESIRCHGSGNLDDINPNCQKD